MAEEIKKEDVEKKNIFPVIFKVILGLVFLTLGAWAVYSWWGDILLLVKGCIGPFLILAGIITLAIARD